jgi:16S rRNA (guanine527-N7)-methyltransferase
MTSQSEQLIAYLQASQSRAGLSFSDPELAQLARYYELALKWNRQMPLTTITEPKDFAERHLIEAALVGQKIAAGVTECWDLGTGLGIPGLVIAVLYPSLRVKLVEANRKKCIFLEEVAFQLSLNGANVVNQRIETLKAPDDAVCLTGRAIDGMEKLIPRILEMGETARQVLLLGTNETESLICLNLADDRTLRCHPLPGRESAFLLEIA